MEEFSTHEVIDQTDFVSQADTLLGQANKSETSIEDAVKAAQSVATRLDDIESGRLEVKPPLSEQQHAGYRERATLVVNIGEKALSGLDQNAQSRKGRKGRGKGLASAAASAAKSAFEGTGSSAKT